MSLIGPDDPYGRPPVPGSPAGWYPMRNKAGLRAKAFGSGPAPVMGWWNGEAWEEAEATVLFDSRRGAWAMRARFLGFVIRAAIVALFVLAVRDLQRDDPAWFLSTVAMVLLVAFTLVGNWPTRTACQLTGGSLTAVALAGSGWTDGQWTVPISAIADLRVSRSLPAWLEWSRIDVVLHDGGRLVARRVAGADRLAAVMDEQGVVVR
jgi:hypothetical protein